MPATPTHTLTPAPTTVPPAGLGLVLACLDALSGRRALHQIRPRMALTAFERLIQERATAAHSSAQVGRIRIQMPHASAIEASTLIECAGTWLACVLRLDHLGGSDWACTDFRVIGPGRG